MKGLLLKDLFMISKYCRSILIIAVVFIAVSFFDNGNQVFMLFYPCMIASMMPMTLYSYDEREKWCAYSAGLPVSRAQYVSAKYIIGLIIGAIAVILIAIAQAVGMIYLSSFELDRYLFIIACAAIAVLIAPSVTLPFMFKYGAEKGRIFYYIVIGVACTVSLILTNELSVTFSEKGVGIVIAVCVAAAIYIVSWLASVAFYKKREL